MGAKTVGAFVPDSDRADAYDALYAEYVRLHDYFGRGGNDVMHRLGEIKRAATTTMSAGASASDVQAVREQVTDLHAELVRNGLVAWTSGNVSARVPGSDLVVIKPSGVTYDDLRPELMVVVDLDGHRVEGDLSPSSDTDSHLYVYREMPEVGGASSTRTAAMPLPGPLGVRPSRA